MKASHVDGQLKLLGSKIFTVKVAFILIKHLDYKRARQFKSFLLAPVFHCKNRDAGSSCSCNSGIVQVLIGDSVVLSSGRKP